MTKPKTFIEVIERGCCRYIGGTEAQPEYCGNKVLPGQSWCAEHRAIVYQGGRKNAKK